MADLACRRRPVSPLLELTPPEYSCAIYRRAHFLLKREFDNPVRPSIWTRQWKRVDAEICGTVLQFSTERRVVKLSLLGGDAGLARDYGKRSNVLRLRVEGRQFLLAADSLGTAIDWVDSLHAAFAIAPPLEYRCEPSFRRLPWKYNSRRDVSLREKLHKKWREQWRASSRNNMWLSEHSRAMLETLSLKDDDGPPIPPKDDQNNRWSMMSAASDSSAWTMFSSVDNPPPPEEQSTALVLSGSIHPPKQHTDPDQSKEKYARILLYDAPWKGSWYFRDGHIYLCRNPLINSADNKWL